MFVFSEIPSRHSFWVFQSSTTCQKLQVPDSGSTLHLLCIMVASCPSLRCSYRKGMCLMQRSRVFGHGVMASRFVTILWLCSQLWCEIAANQKTLVEIELLATVGWKWGCQSFSCRCSQNVTHCAKEICSTSLSKESIPTIPFGNINHPLPARSFRFLRVAVRSTCFALWLHHAHPFVAVAWKTCLIEISRGFGHGVRVSKICYNACAMWLLHQWTIVEIELLATVGWQWGCRPFSCRCWQNVTHCRKEIYSTCLFSGIHSHHSFWESQSCTPCQKQVPESGSTLHLLCIMVASCPSLRCSCMKNLSHRDKQRVWSRS